MNGSGEAPLDLFVVGGGINGAGIACDAVGRALKVGLCEMNDFASATSSASTKLIHGGLRYLEHYEFRLVREALQEREVLLAKAPHLSFPLRFVLPHEPHLRPRWMLRLGLFLYDHLDWHMTLPKSIAVDLPSSKFGAGLKPVVQERLRLFRRLGRRCPAGDRQPEVGAPDGRPHLRPPSLRVGAAQRRRQAVEHRAGRARRRRGEAAGARPGQRHRPLGEALPRRADRTSRPAKRVRLIKGSHIVVPRLHEGDHAFILQNSDKRIVFIIPYERSFSVIGTTDIPVEEGEKPVCTPGGDRLSLRDRQPLHGEAGAAGGRGVDLFRRAPAVRRRRRRSLGGDARLPPRGRRRASARRRCSRCSAARSRPTGGWPSTRCAIWRRTIRTWACEWTAGRALADGELADAPTFEEAFDTLRRLGAAS